MLLAANNRVAAEWGTETRNTATKQRRGRPGNRRDASGIMSSLAALDGIFPIDRV